MGVMSRSRESDAENSQDQPRPATENNKEVPSTTHLISDLSEQVTRLARIEAQLAVREVTQKAKAGVASGVFFAVAALCGLAGAATLIATAVIALSLVVDAWAAGLIVTGALIVLAALCALIGRVQFGRAKWPIPEKTLDSVREDVRVLQGKSGS